ncbi:MAG TPA: glycosyltransferase family 4 protein [Acidimicrobiales bacterium]|nr:glycosyltransferase family 4 protein [Acidimicrobiales bacterium]
MNYPVVHVLYVIDSLAAGGAETSLAGLARPLVARGVRLDVAYLHERPGVGDDLRAAGAEVLSLGGGTGRRDWARSAVALVGRRRPDVVHTTLFEADVAGRLAGRRHRVPIVSTLANVAYGPEQMTNPDLRAWKVRGAQAIDLLTARWVERFHAISSHVAATMARRLLIPRTRIEVVPRGRDPERLGRRTPARRAAARAGLGLAEGDLAVLAAARQEHQKGLDVLVEAWPAVQAAVPRARLLVAGRVGNQTPALVAARHRLGLGDEVRFLGARSDVAELLCAADAFVLPSRWEGLGSVLLEAMALEAPMVVSDLPSVREVVGGPDAACLVPPGDAAALASSIGAALGDPTGCRRRAGEGRRRFLERFTIDEVAAAMVRLYERAAGR